MKIAIASDHAGYEYKQALLDHLVSLGHEPIDFGTYSSERVDYPDFIHPAAAAVSCGELERGIVLGGSGNGEAMAANRHRGVRCALCWNVETARLARAHNNANMVSLGQRTISLSCARAIVDAWLTTPFDGGRHAIRVARIDR
jgi:ribose 5-phosphate isomerase B